MDDLERHLRDVLTDERRALPTSLVPLERVHAGAARRRQRRAVGAGAAAVVAVLAVAGTAIGWGSLTHGRTQAPPVAASSPVAPTATRDESPAPTSAPALRGPAWGTARAISVTATSSRTLVVLGASQRCRYGSCLRLAQSHDGGATFSPLPGPTVAGSDSSSLSALASVTDVRFGSTSDGWLFGSGLWATHDGGRTWARVALPGRALRLEAAGGTAWALVADPSDAQRLHLYRSPVGSDAFTRVRSVVVTGPGDLAVQGNRVVVMGADRSRLWLGGTAGFSGRTSPCAGALQAQLSASSGGFWAKCVTGTLATLAVSSDGLSWSPVTPHGAEVPNSAALGARTAREALVGQGVDPSLARFGSDGTVRPVTGLPAGGTDYVGFTTAEVGYAIGAGALWRTDDGGDTWRRLPLG